MHKLFTLTLFTAGMFVLGAASPAKAEVETYDFDKAHTQILFFVDHLGFSKSQGEFHTYDGNIKFDQENPENSSVEVVIQTDSIDMDDQKWDDHMKNEDFFNVTEYPTMMFKSTGIEVTGENAGKITGDLTLLGVTKPVTLDVTFNKAGKHPFNDKYVAGFSGNTLIKRSEWGMEYGLPMIGNDVHVRLEVEAVRQNSSDSNAPSQE